MSLPQKLRNPEMCEQSSSTAQFQSSSSKKNKVMSGGIKNKQRKTRKDTAEGGVRYIVNVV